MDRDQIINFLEQLDRELASPTKLCLYGSGVFILLGEVGRVSVDLDIAGPYSQANMAELRQAAEKVGLPLNPDEFFSGNHIEWVGPLRLCLPEPQAEGERMVLWQGQKLEIVAPAPADLVASKLIRYDEADRADLQFLYNLYPWEWEEVERAVNRLPKHFRQDSVVRENLLNLKTDMALWASK